jgi:hypothetical protein
MWPHRARFNRETRVLRPNPEKAGGRGNRSSIMQAGRARDTTD